MSQGNARTYHASSSCNPAFRVYRYPGYEAIRYSIHERHRNCGSLLVNGKTPFTVVSDPYQYRFMIPAIDPDWIRFGMLISINSAWTGNFGKLVSSDHFPLFSVPLGQNARLNIKFFQRFGRWLSVVAVHHYSLAGIEAFPVCPWHQGSLQITVRIFTLFSGNIEIFE